MENRISFYQSLAGVGTGLVTAVVSAVALWQSPLLWESIAWQGIIVLLLFPLTSAWVEENHPRLSYLALWVLPPLIFMLSWRVQLDIYFIYTIIWVACSPFYLRRSLCWYYLVAINLGWYFMRALVWQDPGPVLETLLQATFYAFALISATTAKESQEANAKAQQLNRELMATQHLLGEVSRESERTRIARDLHDLLGHHLTALTINLQVAGRLSEGEVKDKVEQCHALSKLLLSDVREAVTTLREMPVVNLRELLEITLKDIPRLNVSLDIDDEIHLDDVNTGQVLLRLVQEAVTNTLKHSNARTASIRIQRQGEKIVLDYTDNGGGCDELKTGNGLQGMRERLELLGGELRIESKPNLSLRATAPLAV